MITKALKKMNSGLAGAKHANTHHDLLVEETGSWYYLVIDPAGIRSRQEPSYSKETKRKGSSVRFKEGIVVQVERRRKCGWTRWLGLTSGEGWLFDVSPKDKRVRMVEVEVMYGSWQYEACINQVPVLPRPVARLSAMKPAKGDPVLELLEVVSIKERVRPLNGKGSFLNLADDRGWVLDFSGGRQAMRRWALGTGQDGESLFDTEEIAISVYNGGDWDEEVRPAYFVPLLSTSPEPQNEVTEVGNWNYMVLDSQGISLRQSPVYTQTEKLQRRVEEGEIVTVLERRPGDGTTFLRLASPAGWAFDVHPKHGKNRVRMMEVRVDHGLWQYRITADMGIALRSRCSFSERTKIGKGPLKGALVTVTQRVKAGETTFLRLKEENGWIFDLKNGRQMAEGPIAVIQQPGATASVISSDGIYLLASPTNQKWALTKRLLIPDSRINVICTCEVENVRWAKISKPGGTFEGWVHADQLNIWSADTSPTCSYDSSPDSPRSAPSSGFGLSGDLRGWHAQGPSCQKVVLVSGPQPHER